MSSNTFPLVFASLFLLFLVAASVAGRLPLAIAATYAVASAVAFLVYAFDKSAARQGKWRTRESSLHLLGLAGGWPGALLAQRMLHHKSRKKSFQVTFWGTVAVNCGAFAWLVSDNGLRFLNHLR
jgi:uncharacterized membrane protein YsdA (DUF1294 family)